MVDRNDHPLKVINLNRVWIFANIFESDLASLRIGDEAKITVDAYPGRVFTGRVAYIGDEVDRTARFWRGRGSRWRARITCSKPGTFAQAAIAIASPRDVIVAPDSRDLLHQWQRGGVRSRRRPIRSTRRGACGSARAAPIQCKSSRACMTAIASLRAGA